MATAKNSQPADTRAELIELVRRRAEIAVSNGHKAFLSLLTPPVSKNYILLTLPPTLIALNTSSAAQAFIMRSLVWSETSLLTYRNNHVSYPDEC